MTPEGFADGVRELLADAVRASIGSSVDDGLRRWQARLDQPLRLVVVGLPSSGRTLLAEELARVGSMNPGPRWRWDVRERVRDTHLPAAADAGLVLLAQDRPDPLPVRLLTDDALRAVPAMATVGVVARADALSPGRGDSLELAARLANELSQGQRLRPLVAEVVAISARLARAAATLNPIGYAQLARLAAAASELPNVDVLASEQMAAMEPAGGGPVPGLVDRFGATGLRLAVALLSSGACRDAESLAAELSARSGVPALSAALDGRVAPRAEQLRAGAALRTCRSELERRGDTSAERLAREADRLLAAAHGLREVQLLERLRTGEVEIDSEEQSRVAESLLGGQGYDARQRLQLPAMTDDHAVRSAAAAEQRRWQRIEEDPFAGRGSREAASVLRRTCEGLLVVAAS